MFARNLNRAEGTARQIGFAAIEFDAIDFAHVADAVGMRLLDDSPQPDLLRLVPGHDQRAGFDQWQIKSLADREILPVAGLHAGQLQAVGRRVETGMQQGAVAFARPGKNVGALFQEHAAQTAHCKPAQDGASDHSAADYGNVKHRVIHWGGSIIGRLFFRPARNRGINHKGEVLIRPRLSRKVLLVPLGQLVSPTAFSAAAISAWRLAIMSPIGGPLKRRDSKLTQIIAMTTSMIRIRIPTF